MRACEVALPIDSAALKRVVDTTGRLLVTWTSGGAFADMCVNLLRSLQAFVPALVPSLVILALDHVCGLFLSDLRRFHDTLYF